MQVVRVRLLAFLPFCFVFVVVFLTIFVTCWLVSLYSYGWLFTAARGVAINVFLVYYRNFLRSWPNFERFGGFFLPEYFSRFVASPVPSPQIVGTSRKQGQGKIRHAWDGERESAPSLSSAPARYLHQFSYRWTLLPWSLEQGICPVTRMAISLQCHIVSDIRATFRLHPCPILTTCSSREAWDSSGTSRRKSCSGKKFTDYKSVNIGVPQWTATWSHTFFFLLWSMISSVQIRPICWSNFQMIKLLAFLL